MDFYLRPATVDDAEDIIKYLDKISFESDFLSFGPNELRISLSEERRIIRAHTEEDNQMMSVAISADEIVGMINVRSTYKKRGRHNGEFGISVLQSHWGKGIGKAMLEHMLKWASNNKIIKKLNLVVLENNEKAIRMYKKYGFEVEGRRKNDCHINGTYLDAVLMGLWLGD